MESISIWLLILGTALIIFDLAIPTVLATHVGIVFLSLIVPIEISDQSGVLIFISWLLSFLFLHTVPVPLLTKASTHVANNIIAPTRHKSHVESLAGSTGNVTVIGSKKFVRLQGDLWEICRSSEGFEVISADDLVQVHKVQDGKVQVSEA